MQLILEADNSEINIKEKMTTVEDSIEKLMNGVAEVEKTSENGNLSYPDKENKLNGDNVIESQNNMESGYKDVLDEVPTSRHKDISENKPPQKEKASNSDKEYCLNGNEGEDILVPLNDEASENVSHLETENSLNVDKVTQFKENIGIGDKSLSEEVNVATSENFSEKEILPKEKVSTLKNEKCLISAIIESQKQIETATETVFKEAPALPNEKIFENESSKSNEESHETGDKTVFKEATALPCGDVSENESTKSNNESPLMESTEIANKINSNEESRVDISKETEMSLDKYEEVKSEEGFKEQLDDQKEIADKQKEVSGNNLKSEDLEEMSEKPGDRKNVAVKQETVHEKILKSKDHEESSEQKITEPKCIDDAMKKAETSTALCENMKDQNDIIMQVKEESSFTSLNVDKHDDYTTVDTKLENSDCVKNQAQASGIDVNECNLEKQRTDNVNVLISESENIPENTATDMQTLVDPVLDSTEMLNSESSDAVKQIDMECDEVIPSVTEPNESTSTTMDCDMDDLDLNKKDSTENLLENVASDQITPKEDSGLDKTTKDNSELNKTNNLENEATTERSEKFLNYINEANEIKEKDTSTITESTVVQKMETSEENVVTEIIKEKVPELTADKTKTSSELKDETETVDKENSVSCVPTKSPCKDVNSDIEEVKVIDIDQEKKSTETPVTSKLIEKPTPVVKLSNTLNILSDDEEEPPKTQKIDAASSKPKNNKQCINIEDDDDVMVIEDTPREAKPETVLSESTEDKKDDLKSDSDAIDAKISEIIKETELSCNKAKESSEPQSKFDDLLKTTEKIAQEPTEESKKEEPLLPKDLFKSYRKNLTEMTRDDLEEFCILKIVESIIDRSSLNEIKTKLKTMSQTIEEYKKKAMMLTKQNRDLQVVLKSIQEEQKKGGDSPIVPLKITRSVGMQVLMTDKNARRKVMPTPTPGPSPNVNNRPARNINQSPRQQPPVTATNQQIPVPRLVPAPNNAAANKTPNPSQAAATRNAVKPNSLPNGVRNSPPAPKSAEKRGRSQSITVDLTDDEPPPKIPAPPVRVVPSQNLLTPRAQMTSNTLTNPRKVYIPIGSNHNQNVRPGQTIMLKNVPNTPGPRPRGAAPMVTRGPTPNQIRMSRVQGRHPAPLPDAVKQYQPPNWKALPPAPDLKLSKVENGIVISWKIDGYQEDSYEEIASYQLYAYQETSSPPNTSLWKKIGDVKALPLPMACTLTQFMAGYKYYFAVRAVDIRSRLGPFSLPGSILLLNKM